MRKRMAPKFLLVAMVAVFLFVTSDSVEAADAYAGITIDGVFTDWDSVEKVSVDNSSLDDPAITNTAMVFDGDFIYIYIEETGHSGHVTWSGPNRNGRFVIVTDLGKTTNFQITGDNNTGFYVAGVDGATLAFQGGIYEIAIPVSEIAEYKETISYGYYLGNLFIENVANLHPDTTTDKSFNGIVYDGMYGDWTYYPHELIQYSDAFSDCNGALYLEENELFGHVYCASTQMHDLCPQLFFPIKLRFNHLNNDGKLIELKPVELDENNDAILYDELFSHSIYSYEEGVYEYYLWDNNASEDHKNINDSECPIYGKILLTVTATELNAEYVIDMDKMAAHFGLDVTDLQLIEAYYVRLGDEWISTAGTSTGPIVGMILSMSVVSLGFATCLRKQKGH